MCFKVSSSDSPRDYLMVWCRYSRSGLPEDMIRCSSEAVKTTDIANRKRSIKACYIILTQLGSDIPLKSMGFNLNLETMTWSYAAAITHEIGDCAVSHNRKPTVITIYGFNPIIVNTWPAVGRSTKCQIFVLFFYAWNHRWFRINGFYTSVGERFTLLSSWHSIHWVIIIMLLLFPIPIVLGTSTQPSPNRWPATGLGL